MNATVASTSIPNGSSNDAIKPSGPADTTRSTPKRPPGLLRTAWTLGRTKAGAVVSLFVVAIALFGPLVSPHGSEQYIDGAPTSARTFKGLALGTDYAGYDVVARFLHGGRSIIVMAFFSSLLGVGLGAILGMTAAYVRGRADEILMRVLDTFLAFPQILLSLLVIAMFDPRPLVIILTIGLTTVPRVARVIRGAALSVVERDFIGAADAIGEKRLRVLFSEVLPNVTAPLLVEANLRFTFAIGLIASLAFLGFTPRVGIANWGLMVQENGGAISIQPWPVVLPVIAIALLTIGMGLVADGLSRAIAGVDRGKAEV
jgi:peptide/nickel transport system permease protein